MYSDFSKATEEISWSICMNRMGKSEPEDTAEGWFTLSWKTKPTW